jgi:hypothetical protein
LEGYNVKVSLRAFGSYVKFNKKCYYEGYKCGTVNTFLTPSYFQHLLQDKNGTD